MQYCSAICHVTCIPQACLEGPQLGHGDYDNERPGHQPGAVHMPMVLKDHNHRDKMPFFSGELQGRGGHT